MELCIAGLGAKCCAGGDQGCVPRDADGGGCAEGAAWWMAESNGVSKDFQRSQKSPKIIEKLFEEPSNLRNLPEALYVPQKAPPCQNIYNFSELSTNSLWVGG